MALLNVGCLILILAAIANNAQAVSIEPNVRTLSVAQGSELVLNCILPNAKVGQFPNWDSKPQGAQLKTDSLFGESKGSTMTFTSYNETSVKEYTCKFGTTSAQITVVPVNETKIGDHFYFGNKTATLACSIEVHGTHVFKEWLFDNTTLTTGGRYTVQETNVTIDKPKRDDSGPYYAVFEITVPGMDPVEHKCQVDYTAGPLVMDLARSASAELGEDLDIYCDVKGYPKAVITWLRNMQNITRNGTTYSEYLGFKGAHITIKNAQFSDAGNYTCFAYSAEFQNSSAKHIIIRIKDPIAWLWPLVGILAEFVLLTIVIVIFRFFEKRKQAKDMATFNAVPVPEREKDE